MLAGEVRQLARYLIERGIGPGDRVLLALPRSGDAIRAQIAILAADAAFVPVDVSAPIERIVFVGTAASRWEVASVPENTLVIHGETDDTVPIQSVYDWARPQELPVVVIPGAEHFLHRKLHVLKRIIVDAWR